MELSDYSTICKKFFHRGVRSHLRPNGFLNLQILCVGKIGLRIHQHHIPFLQDHFAVWDQCPALPFYQYDDAVSGNVKIPDGMSCPGMTFF